MPYALLASIAALAMWTVWVVRSGRAAAWAKAIPVIAGLAAGGLQLAAMHAFQNSWQVAAEANPAEKTHALAEGLGHASFLAVAAWTVVAVAALLLVVFTLRAPQDVREPRARVVS
jgi:hypothetical protein